MLLLARHVEAQLLGPARNPQRRQFIRQPVNCSSTQVRGSTTVQTHVFPPAAPSGYRMPDAGVAPTIFSATKAYFVRLLPRPYWRTLDETNNRPPRRHRPPGGGFRRLRAV